MFVPFELCLPAFPFKIKEHRGIHYIFDEIRKKFLVLTPEEWVRQHFVQFLIADKKYPKSLFRLEGGLTLNSLKKRSDILVYNSRAEKVLLVECKAPSVKIDQSTFDQVARYNIIHRVPLLAVTNGLQHYYCKVDHEKQSYQFLETLPDYESAF